MIQIPFYTVKNPITHPITESKMDTSGQKKTNPDGFGLIPKSQLSKAIKNIQFKAKACSVQYIL